MKNKIYSTNGVVQGISELLEYYRQHAEHIEDLRIGVEWERFGVYTDTLKVVPYKGNQGYLEILKYLHGEKGWEIEDTEEENIFTLVKGRSRITVEGDGKPEISAAPHASLHDLAAEIINHRDEIEEISRTLGISWIPLGIQPFASVDEISLVPKKRYQLWDRIFKDHREWIHVYMKTLAGLHINFGYVNENNLIRKVQMLMRLSPLMAAMFANSPYEAGKKAKCIGTRREKIFTNGPGQEKLMEGILSKDFSMEKWITWYIDQNLIIFPFDQDIVVPKGWTFKTWMKQGYKGRFPTFLDFDQHLKTRWTDFRFRPAYLEYRVIDTLPFPLLMAATAFMKGLVFDERGCKAVEDITKTWTDTMIHELHIRGCREGLRTDAHGVTFLDIAKELLCISKRNLKEFNFFNDKGEDESIFLGPLERLLEKGFSPAEDLLEFTQGDPKRTLDWINKEF